MHMIKRKIEKEEENDFFNKSAQFSINSDGFFVIRLRNNMDLDKDILIVFNPAETNRLINFVKRYMIEK